jgi:hypothetical protein
MFTNASYTISRHIVYIEPSEFATTTNILSVSSVYTLSISAATVTKESDQKALRGTKGIAVQHAVL